MNGEDRDDPLESDEDWSPVEPTAPTAMSFERFGRRVDAHPWLAIGIAATAGAALAFVPHVIRRVRRRGRVERTLGEGALALLGAIAARVVRDYAIDGIAAVAHKWRDKR